MLRMRAFALRFIRGLEMYDPLLVEDCAKLLNEGFTAEQIAALIDLRRHLQRNHDEGQAIEHKRLEFARWLVEHNLLLK
jgi:hypothetical protein